MNFNDIENKLCLNSWNTNQFVSEYSPHAISYYRKTILGKIVPETKDQVLELVNLVSGQGIVFFPISRGNNWAFGSEIPFDDNCIILDLSKINHITELDETFGTIRITPGVSQGQLESFLKKQKSNFYIDVTGSGAETSVLGNTLERGIAYNTLRVESLVSLEVLLPDGEVIHTGFSSQEKCDVKNLYSYGLGPDLKGLFLQSNLGIVLSATIQLKKHQESVVTFQISIEESSVGSLVDGLSSLMGDGVIDCIPHIGDPLRVRSTITPILQNSENFTDSDLKAVLERLKLVNTDVAIWSCLGNIQGPKAIVRAKQKVIKKRLSSIARVNFFDEQKIAFASKYLNWGPFKKTIKFIQATASLRGLIEGKATSEAVKMLYWSPTEKNPVEYKSNGEINLEKTPYGCLFCVPLTTMNKVGAEKLIYHLRRFSREYSITMGATLNALSVNVLEAVISFHFDPRKQDSEYIHELFIRFNRELIADGLYPYRMNPDLMPHCLDILPHPSLSKKIKSLIDPNHMISPNHYIGS